MKIPGVPAGPNYQPVVPRRPPPAPKPSPGVASIDSDRDTSEDRLGARVDLRL